MKKNYLIIFIIIFSLFSFGQTKVFINEIHYDNAEADANEGIEIAGPSGTNLSSYALTLYNGSDNSALQNYQTFWGHSESV